MKLFALPNWFTLGNLLCGCLGILSVTSGDLLMAALFVGIAALFDFLDGFVARISGQSSPVGKDLDSLADMVTFGVLPGFILFELFLFRGTALTYHDMRHLGDIRITLDLQFEMHGYIGMLLPYAGFLVTLFSALRLAKFNNDTRQSDSFIGVPTPAVTMFVASLPFILHHPTISDPGTKYHLPDWNITPPTALDSLMLHPAFLGGLIVVLCFLLISEIPLFALKFKKFGWKGNEIRYLFLLACLAIIILAPRAAFALIIPLYVLVSVVNNLLTKKESAAVEKQ